MQYLEKIGEILTRKGFITKDTVNDVLIEQELSLKKFGELLTEKGVIEESTIIESIAEQAGFGFIKSLNGASLITEDGYSDEFYWKNCCALIKKDNGIKFVYNVNNNEVNSVLTSLRFKKDTEICLSTKEQIYKFLSDNTEFESINTSDNFSVEIYNAIEIAVAKKSSNIRIKKTNQAYLILVDTDTGVEIIKAFKEDIGLRLINIVADLCKVQLKPGRSLEAKFSYKSVLSKRNVDIRVEFLPAASKTDDKGYYEAVLRLHGLNSILDLIALGFDKEEADLLNEISTYSSGLVLSAGPTGAGKSTTFYAILKELAKKRLPILTIEDPVEIKLNEINITQMSVSDNYRYESALVAMLRCEPKIILVGEIRDNETAMAVLKAAQTGHLVLSTIHTQSAVNVISRLKGMGVGLDEMLDVIKLATSQRLYAPLCPDCREKRDVNSLKKAWIKPLEILGIKDEPAYIAVRGNKCDKCNGTGYLSKKAVIEILPFRANVINDIRMGNKVKYNTLGDKAVKMFRDGTIDAIQLFNVAG